MNNKTEVQLDFVNDQIRQEHEQRLLKQKTLSAVNPLNVSELLRLLKQEHSSSLQAYSFEATAAFLSTIATIKNIIGWQTMTKEQKQAIDDYLNN